MTKLPTSLVSELATTTSQAQEAWKHARQNSDFAAFVPKLERVFERFRRTDGEVSDRGKGAGLGLVPGPALLAGLSH